MEFLSFRFSSSVNDSIECVIVFVPSLFSSGIGFVNVSMSYGFDNDYHTNITINHNYRERNIEMHRLHCIHVT